MTIKQNEIPSNYLNNHSIGIDLSPAALAINVAIAGKLSPFFEEGETK